MDIAGSLAGNLTLRPDGQRTRARLKVDAKDLTLSGLAGSAASRRARGSPIPLHSRRACNLPKLNGAAVTLGASGNFNLDAQELSVASALGSYGGQEIRLLEPARIHFGNGIAVDLLKLGAQKGRTRRARTDFSDLGLRASLRQVQPALVNVFLPNLLAAGVIEAHADLHGTVPAPRWERSR